MGFRRHHHLCVSVAKHVFHDVSGTLAISEQPVHIEEARQLELAPVVLFAVSTFGAPLYWAKLARLNNIPSLAEVLQEAWQTAAGLRGPPDAVIVTVPVARAAPTLHAWLESAGVELRVGTDTKTHAAVLRTMQREILNRLYATQREHPSRIDFSTFAAEVRRYHGVQLRWMDLPASAVRRECKQWWVQLPRREVPPLSVSDPAWIEVGNWATAWEATLPPTHSLRLDVRSGISHIVERSPDVADPEGEPVESVGREIVRTVKRLMACWPNELTEVAHSLGTTARQLQRFFTGQEDSADFPYERLIETFSFRVDEYQEGMTQGPHVLLAKGTVRATRELFEDITGGGDQEYSFEVVPVSGTPDPSFRYILFARCFEPESPFVLMVPRGTRLAQRLSADLINLESQPRTVSESFYQDIVATCGRACRDSIRNRTELMGLAHRHAKRLVEEFARHPRSLPFEGGTRGR